eukprot:m.53936 g.53936  ORF g.53936 m.53936 type:complete len:110 (-) comp9173_c0_seq2:688-1017(-)
MRIEKRQRLTRCIVRASHLKFHCDSQHILDNQRYLTPTGCRRTFARISPDRDLRRMTRVFGIVWISVSSSSPKCSNVDASSTSMIWKLVCHQRKNEGDRCVESNLVPRE